MKNRHMIIVILPSGNINKRYDVDNIDTLIDDMCFLYDGIDIQTLIKYGRVWFGNLKFLYHKFEW